MKIILAIGMGSFLGGISRYLLSLYIQQKFSSSFPFGTLVVNIIGCFLIGIILGLTDKGNLTQEWRLFFATGIIGGFTTFSAFSGETINMLQDGQLWYAILYIAVSLIVGLIATFIGISIIKIL